MRIKFQSTITCPVNIWLHHRHYFVGRIDARGICLDAMDESFHVRLLPGIFIFQIIKPERFCRELQHV